MNLLGVAILLVSVIAGLASLCWKKSRAIGVCLIACAVGFSAVRLYAEGAWKRKFEALPDGIAEREVQDSLWWKTLEFEDGKSPLGYALRDRHPEVKKEIWCVAFFLPEQYAFGFDSTGRLVARYHYVSP